MPHGYDADTSTINAAPSFGTPTETDEKMAVHDDSATEKDAAVGGEANDTSDPNVDATKSPPPPSGAEKLSTVQIALLMSALCVRVFEKFTYFVPRDMCLIFPLTRRCLCSWLLWIRLLSPPRCPLLLKPLTRLRVSSGSVRLFCLAPLPPQPAGANSVMSGAVNPF